VQVESWRTTISCLFVVAVTTALVVGCASNAPTKQDNSGYLGSYQDLKEAEGPNVERFLRYANPMFTPLAFVITMASRGVSGTPRANA